MRSAAEFPDHETSTLSERLNGPKLLTFVSGYFLILVLAAVVVWAFLGPVERYERRVALDQQEAFSGYRTASTEQGR